MTRSNTAIRASLFLPVALSSLLACSSSDHPEPTVAQVPELPLAPVARVVTAADQHHGVSVADPYRWLEDWDDAAVQAWSGGQNEHARAVLNSMPEREAVHTRMTEILKSGASVSYGSLMRAGDHLLAMKNDPEQQQAILVRMGLDADPGGEVNLIDPNTLDAQGSTTIDWFEPSQNGELVAVSMSRHGSEQGDVSIYRVADGEQLDVVVPRVNGGTAGGDLAWLADDSGYYYTRYPHDGERPDEDMHFYQQVYLHLLGTEVKDDRYVIGAHFPRIAETRLMVDRDSERLLVWVQDGDSNRFSMFLLQPDGEWSRFSDFGDGHKQPVFGPDGSIFVMSRAGEPKGRIVRLDGAAPDFAKAIEVVPAQDGAFFHSFYSHSSPSLLIAGGRIHALVQAGGPTELVIFDLEGNALEGPELLPVSTVFGLAKAGDSSIYFGNISYVASTRWHRFDAVENNTEMLAVSSQSTVDYSDVTVVREFAVSRDGTRVPVNILIPEGAPRDGTRAILVTGYGGYGVNITPSLSKSRHILFENGVLFAQANLRGGGEYGEQWHREGNLTNKQNVFDDFHAVVQHLVDRGYAAADRVAIVGSSNGGLLMGAILTQHPQLAAAVVSHVGIYDSIRSELEPNGEFNIPEFGTVKDPDQFAALMAYSPYHHVVDGQRYPAILLPTGANDPRVNPMHSRKFTARLQAADPQGTILLRTSSSTGHGGGTPLDEVIELLTDQYAFVFHHVGDGDGVARSF